MSPIPAPRFLLAAAGIAAILAGCGSSGPTDKAQISAIIKREGASPVTLCSHLTEELLASLGGKSGCVRQAASAATDRTTHVTSVRVHGSAATALVVDRSGQHAIRLVKRRGAWKIAAVS